jgi:hypothetical protein
MLASEMRKANEWKYRLQLRAISREGLEESGHTTC